MNSASRPSSIGEADEADFPLDESEVELSEAEIEALENLLRRLRPKEPAEDLRWRLEQELLADRRVIAFPRWLPVAAAAIVVLGVGLSFLRPGVPAGPASSLAENSQGGEAQAAVVPPGSLAAADAPASGPSPQGRAAFDQAVAQQVLSQQIRRSELGRQVGLSNRGLIRDDQGRPLQMIDYEFEESHRSGRPSADEQLNSNQLSRQRTLLVPLEYY